MNNSQLIESLNKYISKISEDWFWSPLNNREVEYVKNPAPNELHQFLKEKGKLRAMNDKDGNWYFWSAKDAIHNQFSSKIFGISIKDYFESFKRGIYHIVIDKDGKIVDNLFSSLVDYFEFEEFSFSQIQKYMKDFLKQLKVLEKYNFKLSTESKNMLSQILSGEAFE